MTTKLRGERANLIPNVRASPRWNSRKGDLQVSNTGTTRRVQGLSHGVGLFIVKQLHTQHLRVGDRKKDSKRGEVRQMRDNQLEEVIFGVGVGMGVAHDGRVGGT